MDQYDSGQDRRTSEERNNEPASVSEIGHGHGQGSAASRRGIEPVKTDDLKKFKITKITGFRHVCKRPKFVGKNAFRDNHGDQTSENILWIATDQGADGIGIGSAPQDVARKLLGHTLDEYWKPGVGVVSPLGRADHALYDLIGKALKLPAWKLFGGQGPEWVPIYDGSIYFNDILPEFKDRGVARLLQEVETSLKAGHRAFKIKVGRGFKWMPKDEGFRRDVEVVQSIRKLAGKDVKLMVDANNGFDLETTKKWLDAVGDELFFIEEMFPEVVEQDLNLKKYLKDKGWKTLVADGESAREVTHFDDFIKNDALDVLQPDIRAYGLTLQWELSRKICRQAEHQAGAAQLGIASGPAHAAGARSRHPELPDGGAGHGDQRPLRHLGIRVQGRQDEGAGSAGLRPGHAREGVSREVSEGRLGRVVNSNARPWPARSLDLPRQRGTLPRI